MGSSSHSWDWWVHYTGRVESYPLKQLKTLHVSTKTEDPIYFKQDMAQPNKEILGKKDKTFSLTVLGIHSHDACMVRFWLRVPSGCTLPPAPSVFLASCLTYSYEDTNSFHGGCTFKIWLLPKGPPSNVITLRLRFQHMNFGKRGAQTFNPLLRAIRVLGASVRKAGEIPSWSLSSIWKTGCELGLNPAQEWGNCC